MKHYRILFVCLGNICRSPMAEYVFRHTVREHGLAHCITTASAGTSGWHDGEDMHRGTRSQLIAHHIDPAGFVSRKIRRSDIDDYDFLIAMDDGNLNELTRQFGRLPEKIFKLTDLIPESGYQSVPDPWYTGDFDETYRLVQAASLALIRKLQSDSPPNL